jgi:type IV pilus assembly protein PilC
MKFTYKARDKDGQLKAGEVIASDEGRAELLLEENGLVVISLAEKQEDILAQINPFGHSVSNKDLVMYSRQLATLISARVPILQALRILDEQLSSKYLHEITQKIISYIENGESLSVAMARHGNVFNNVYVSMVKSGEASGSLDKSLVYLADQLEKDYELLAKVKTAMTYPVFVLVALVVIMGLMFKFVMPNLTSVLVEQGGTLPPISVFLVNFTTFFNAYWWAVILVLAGIVLGLRFYASRPLGKRQIDILKLRFPIIGDIFQKIYLARFSRNLSTLTQGGIPIIKALEIVSEVIGNTVYRDILLETISNVTAGKTISEGLSGHKREFPNIVTQMVKVGEQTAKLDDILGKLASFYEKEVDAKISTLTTLLEPIIMIILGIGVGVLVAGILMPIYNLAGTAG